MNVLQMFHTLFIMDVNSQTLPKLEAGRITESRSNCLWNPGSAVFAIESVGY